MIWRNARRLSRLLHRQGIQNPGPIDLNGPLQTVQLTDDALYNSPPPAVPNPMVRLDAVGGGAGTNSGIAISTGTASAVLLMGTHAVSASLSGFMWKNAGPLATEVQQATIVPAWLPASLASYREVDVPTGVIPAQAAIWDTAVTALGKIQTKPNFWIWPGEVLYYVSATANQAFNISIQTREVPS